MNDMSSEKFSRQGAEENARRWIHEVATEEIEPIVVLSEHRAKAAALLQGRAANAWIEALDSLRLYAPEFFGLMINDFGACTENIVYAMSDIDTEEEEEEAIDQMSDKMLELFLAAVAPIYCANDSIWPSLGDNVLLDSYWKVSIKYSEHFGALWKDLMELIGRYEGDEYKESFRARMKSAGLHAMQITVLAIIIIAYLRKIPCYPCPSNKTKRKQQKRLKGGR